MICLTRLLVNKNLEVVTEIQNIYTLGVDKNTGQKKNICLLQHIGYMHKFGNSPDVQK